LKKKKIATKRMGIKFDRKKKTNEDEIKKNNLKQNK
jgi:hypothetical protein